MLREFACQVKKTKTLKTNNRRLFNAVSTGHNTHSEQVQIHDDCTLNKFSIIAKAATSANNPPVTDNAKLYFFMCRKTMGDLYFFAEVATTADIIS